MTATHCQRVLDVLADGKPHTTRDLYRKAGPMILHSRVAELRKRGHNIVCEHIAGKGTGAGAYRYTWVDAPAGPDSTAVPGFQISTDEIAPRVTAERYRIFRVKNGGPPEIVATVATLAEIGPALYTLGTEGEFDDYCLGLQDALDHEKDGKWVGKWFVLQWQKGI